MIEDTARSRWRLIEDLFAEALELPPEDRARFLEEAAAGDPDLHREVSSLLESAASADQYFAGIASRAGMPRSQESQMERLAGREVGRWRLLHLIGRGGMGAVYLAERSDDQFQMRAALKVLPVGMTSAEAQRRFMAERQILARLSHPGIARLLDGGVMEDGTPYYVMEYVEGRPITAYCSAGSISLSERLDLFLAVCEAVSHAHRNLVVHRDLKPSNILVAADDRVKLLDFGIAKVLDADGASSVTGSSRLGNPLTLAYASPEQVRAEPATTACDVYSLGVLLYELLTGIHPYRSGLATPVEAERTICHTMPPPPSAAVHEHATRRDLRGDLDTIVLTAIRKEPERRYGSVAALAEDVRRYQAHRPILARPDRVGYRVARFVRRNRVATMAGIAIAVLLLSWFGTWIWAMRRDQEQGRRIAEEAAISEEATRFLEGLFASAEISVGFADTVKARSLLDQGKERLLASASQSPATRLRLMASLAQTYHNMGLYQDEEEVLAAALDLARPMDGGAGLRSADLITRLADSHHSERNYEESERLYREALAIYQRLDPSSSRVVRLRRGVALAMRERAPDSALMLLREVHAVPMRHQDARLERLQVAHDLALMFRATGQTDSAELLYREVLDQVPALGDSGVILRATALNNYGFLVRSQNRWAEAESLYREALVLERTLERPSYLFTLPGNLAAVTEQMGQAEEMNALLTERVALAIRTWTVNNWRTGAAHVALGDALLSQGRTAEALEQLQEGTRIYAAVLGPEHRWTANARVLLGRALAGLGRYPEGERELLSGYRILTGQLGAEHREVQAALAALVALYDAWGRAADAGTYRGRLTRPDRRKTG